MNIQDCLDLINEDINLDDALNDPKYAGFLIEFKNLTKNMYSSWNADYWRDNNFTNLTVQAFITIDVDNIIKDNFERQAQMAWDNTEEEKAALKSLLIRFREILILKIILQHIDDPTKKALFNIISANTAFFNSVTTQTLHNLSPNIIDQEIHQTAYQDGNYGQTSDTYETFVSSITPETCALHLKQQIENKLIQRFTLSRGGNTIYHPILINIRGLKLKDKALIVRQVLDAIKPSAGDTLEIPAALKEDPDFIRLFIVAAEEYNFTIENPDINLYDIDKHYYLFFINIASIIQNDTRLNPIYCYFLLKNKPI